MSVSAAGGFSVKVQFDIDIRHVLMEVDDGTELQVLWVRGNRKIDTKVKTVTDGKAVFKERFSMKTSIEFDPDTRKSKPKPTGFQILGKNQQFLGECSIDIASFARGQQIKEKIKLEKCETPKPSYLEIALKVKDIDPIDFDGQSQASGVQRATTMGKRNDEDPEELKEIKQRSKVLEEEIARVQEQIDAQKGTLYNLELQVEKN